MTLLFTLILTVLLQRNTCLFFFLLLLFSTSLTLNALLMIWRSGQTILFLSFLAKTALAYLPIALSVALSHIFFSTGPVCSSFSAEACAILQALCWSRQHQEVCHFSSLLLLSDSRSVLATLSSPSYFFLPQSLSNLFSLFSSSVRLQWVPGHSFLPDNDADDELARLGALLVPSAIPCRHSSLISGIHFSRTGGVLSHLNFLTHRLPRFPLKNLCLYVMLAVFSSRLRCNGHSLLLSSYLSRIGRIENPFLQHLRTPGPEHLSSHSALCSYELFSSLVFWQFSVSLRPLFQALGSFPGFWGSMVFRHQPIHRKGRITTTATTAKLKLQTHYYVAKRVSKFRGF